MKRSPVSGGFKIEFDERSLSVGGRRQFLISGEIHYSRAPREEWPLILDAAVKTGLNCVAIYVFWNWHEREKDVFDFSGDRDMGHFLDLCAERNLLVFLRLGPYCCGEWNYGGFPPYLRDEQGITIRTHSAPYLSRVEKFFRHLAAEVVPHLSTRGGPVIMVQVENEYDNVSARYGKDGQRYLDWLNQLVGALGFDVPHSMCEAASSVKGGAASGALPSVNGFSISKERVEEFRKAHPGSPLLWTELWPGWYDTWGYQRHGRDARNIASYILQFVGLGGCGWNYYMGYAGTNFGRNSMYLQTTNYGFGALIDPWGRPGESHAVLRDLHEVLRENEEVLLDGDRWEMENGAVWRHGSSTISLALEQNSVVLRNAAGIVLFDTAAKSKSFSVRHKSWNEVPVSWSWECWLEPFPSSRPDKPIVAPNPCEQLILTSDRSDYCWYAAEVSNNQSGSAELDIPFCGDFLRVFLDGKLVGHTPLPLAECRGCTLPGIDPGEVFVQGVAAPPGGAVSQYRLRLDLPVKLGPQRLEILACALGLIKGDWMVAGSMETERKGIWDRVLWNGAPVENWSMFPGLLGETENLANFSHRVSWQRPAGDAMAPAWYRTHLELPEKILKGRPDFRLDAKGLGKGMLFINGHALGRHWLIEGQGFGNDEFWVEADKHGLVLGPLGEPTQRYYKIPACWLKSHNELVVFEEEKADFSKVRLEVRE